MSTCMPAFPCTSPRDYKHPCRHVPPPVPHPSSLRDTRFHIAQRRGTIRARSRSRPPSIPRAPGQRSPDCALPAWSSLSPVLSPYSPFPMASLSLSRAVRMSAYPVDPWQFFPMFAFPMFALTREKKKPVSTMDLLDLGGAAEPLSPSSSGAAARAWHQVPSFDPPSRGASADARRARIRRGLRALRADLCRLPRRSVGWNQRERGERNKGEISQGRR